VVVVSGEAKLNLKDGAPLRDEGVAIGLASVIRKAFGSYGCVR